MGNCRMNISLIVSIVTFSLIFSTEELPSSASRLRTSEKIKGMNGNNGTCTGFCGCISQCSSECLDGHHKGGAENGLVRGSCLLQCVHHKCLGGGGGGGGETNGNSSSTF